MSNYNNRTKRAKMLKKKDLESIKQTIVSRFNPKVIFLFGSYAYGNPLENSDVDLLVIDERANSKNEDLAFEINKALFPRNYHLDLITYTPTEFESKINSKRAFFLDIVKKGKVIYERN